MLSKNLKEVIVTIDTLRDPQNGCPWLNELDLNTLKPYLLKEVYEYLEALEKFDYSNMKEELGDMLFHVILSAKMIEQLNFFNLDDIAKELNEKLIRRHPHVFTDKEKLSLQEIEEQWEIIKAKEKKQEGYLFKSKLLQNAPMLTSIELGEISQTIDFDWQNPKDVWNKVAEEYHELQEVLFMNPSNIEKIEEEFGDLLFTLMQLSRHLKLNPEMILSKANKKFISRMQKMEDKLKKNNESINNTTQKALEKIWQEIKKE